MILQAVAIILLCIWLYKKNSDSVPGPPILPFCGSAPFLLLFDTKMISYPYRMMYKVAQKYGNVMKVGLGMQDWYVLSSFEEIQEFSMTDFSVSHLPSKTFDELYSFDRPLGIIFPDGALWKDQRKFGVKTLRQLGVGKSSLEDKMVLESSKLVQYMNQLINGKSGVVAMSDFFDLPSLNIIWGLINSSRFEYTDQKLKEQIQLINKFTMESTIGPLVAMRSLKYVPPFSFIYSDIKNNMDKFKLFIRNLVNSETERFREDEELKGYIDAFLTEKNKYTVLCTGGSGTMSKTLAYAVLYCTLYPQVAEKVVKELDEHTSHLPVITLASRNELVYTEATITEISRLASVLPIAPPRKTTGDIKVGKYTLPKGSLVQMNLYAMHRNIEHWGDPEVFRPERFLKDGKFVQDEWVQPFGYGKRKCIGESVARNNTFLMFSNMMRNFKFSPSPSHPLPSTEPVGGLTIGPQEYSVLVESKVNKY
ncbi:methyl farnesoate epoxidase [Eurytemora carolleeae]|uniref:methyl farnesoate epoxidase n=1 Tax=Eurytemora carolleeae TaxID=1294199 RepID=UPI000C76B1C1|nr:methyl farnesoate epoxidase [Eurytemora carolleeae]|eukprot:XP_023340901.1 methyl farnesoate epoxidase-like [Eurytemora affinis]